MAKIDFNTAMDANNGYSGNGNNNPAPGSDVGFFTLRNDGDEAIVRFLYESTDDFEILAVHNVTVGGKYRKVNCIRSPHDPLDMCPLCNSGSNISLRFFIKMIQYVTDPATGRVTPKAVIWERATAYAQTLKTYIDNYGPLSDVICKVVRHGKAGDVNTTYEIVPNLNKNVYRDDIYVKDVDLFGDFTCDGTFVMNKTAPEMCEFLATGSFPQKPSTPKEEVTPRTYNQEPPVSVPPAANTPAYGNGFANTAGAANMTGGYATPTYNATANFQAPPVTTTQPQFTAPVNQAPTYNNPPQDATRPTMPWETATPANTMGRPVRRY